MRKKTHEEFMEDFSKNNPNFENIEVLGKYEGADKGKIIKCRCKIDGHVWSPHPSRLLSGSGCHQCDLRKRTKTHKEFVTELYEINPKSQLDYLWNPMSLFMGGCHASHDNARVSETGPSQ